MHYYKGNPSKSPYICIKFDPSQIGNLMTTDLWQEFTSTHGASERLFPLVKRNGKHWDSATQIEGGPPCWFPFP